MTASLDHNGEFKFTPAHFRQVAEVVRQTAGINLPESKKSLVYARLVKRIRKLGLPSFDAYCELILAPEGKEEFGHALSALTTNVTRFFRESHHFDHFRERIMPDLAARAREGGRVRIWSAACSTGEEAYSLGLTALEVMPTAPSVDLRILASDIDPVVVARAEEGQYPVSVLQDIPQPVQKFIPMVDRESVRAGPDLHKLISYRELNLISESWPMRGTFDVIMCRNVAIYFDRPVQEKLWQQFHAILAPGGTLYIGHSERVSGPAADFFRNSDVTTYTKIA